MPVYRKTKVAAHSICNLRYVIPSAILVDTHNKTNFDFRLVLKHLADEFEVSSFKGLVDNTD